jgi:hypothetical protein
MAAVLALSITACKKKEEEIFTPGISDEVRETQTFTALAIMTTETFSLEIKMDEVEVKVCRDGENMAITFFGILVGLIREGNNYDIDYENGIAYYSPATQADRDEILYGFEDYDKIVNLDGAKLIGTGHADFMGRGEHFYEEFRTTELENRRVFFNAEGEIVGMDLNAAGVGMAQVVWHISEIVDEIYFEPETYGFTAAPGPKPQ